MPVLAPFFDVSNLEYLAIFLLREHRRSAIKVEFHHEEFSKEHKDLVFQELTRLLESVLFFFTYLFFYKNKGPSNQPSSRTCSVES